MIHETGSELLRKYEQGVLTKNGVVGLAFEWLDPDNPSVILEGLPSDVLDQMFLLVPGFPAGQLLTVNGNLPIDEQVSAVNVWIENRRAQSKTKG